MRALRPFATLLGLLAASAIAGAGGQTDASGNDAEVPGRVFETALPPAPGQDRVEVPTFRLDRLPVTNGEFASFVADFPEWRRDRVPSLLADGGYLEHWAAPENSDPRIVDRPVTHVSWFAATGYCEAQGKRLPRWHEWELAAAAGETDEDARDDPSWRQQILAASVRSTTVELPAVGKAPMNAYGVGDLHGVVWEWVEDFNGLLVSPDNRAQDDPELMRFCGTGAIAMEQKEHYAILMRIAMLSSLRGRDTTAALGFRCARDLAVGQ